MHKIFKLSRGNGQVGWLTLIVALVFSFAPVAIAGILDDFFQSKSVTYSILRGLQVCIIYGFVAIAIAPSSFPFREIWHTQESKKSKLTNGYLGRKLLLALLIISLIQFADAVFSATLSPSKFRTDIIESFSMIPIFDSESLLSNLDRLLPYILLAPIAEELIFRGLLLNFLFSRVKTVPAILIAALIFAALHGNYFGTFLAGIFLGLVYVFHGKLSYCIILHGLANFLSLAAIPSVQKNLDFVIDSLNSGAVRVASSICLLGLLALSFRAFSQCIGIRSKSAFHRVVHSQ
ncbi:CPBP family intramembrane glutamic endopeptidase [Massilia sp. TWR1-2-2]|uniref:CPBP family intramembrane glutamic endopeptidase n=1 Tax=Massilia sp. TWR1-2-2 TaxID=2804584 RepID=UPI003CF0AEC5